MKRKSGTTPPIDWDATTWEGHRRRQLEQWAKLTLDEILDAQEEMAELAAQIARAPVRKARQAARSKAPTSRRRRG